jgi:site-specific recombinase XerD
MTKKHNARNERIKRRYLEFLKHARRQSEQSIDKAAAIERFDAWNRRKDFHQFHIEQPIAFKEYLERERHPKTGRPLSMATLEGILRPLRAFFTWLADQEGYRKRIRYSDADYFNLSRKDQRLARSGDARPAPSPEQVRHILSVMPATTEIEMHNRAIVALLSLTGARVKAVTTLRIKHLNLAERSLYQSAREVRTKYAKTMRTYFIPGFLSSGSGS